MKDFLYIFISDLPIFSNPRLLLYVQVLSHFISDLPNELEEGWRQYFHFLEQNFLENVHMGSPQLSTGDGHPDKRLSPYEHA